MNLKSQKGSITLFVLVSCLFFLASVACVNLYMQSKQVAVDREYRQIKANYEKDINNMDSIYAELASKNNLSINFGTSEINKIDKKISVNVYTNLEYLDINTLKYGWYYSSNSTNNPSASTITNWTYVETQYGENEFIANCNYTEDTGFYYLCTMIDNKAFWMQKPIMINSEVKNGLVLHLDGINNLDLGDENHDTTTTIWKDLSGKGNDVTIQNASSLTWEGNCLKTNKEETLLTPWEFNSSYTISVVFSPLEYYDYNTIWDNNLTNNDNECWIYANGQLKARSKAGTYINSNRVLVDINEMTQISVTVDATNNSCSIYKNGSIINTITGDNIVLNNGNLTFNGSINTKGYNRYYSVRVYNRALSEAEIQRNYIIDNTRFNIEE
ncbi:MAG TPA: hypothetical protein DEP51_01160 [Clostridiales bacterium]|nr:hypothetical protein [Clostridiales bacterium]